MSVDRLAALFDAHEERLYRLARRLSASADDANDLVQETFVRAARASLSVPAGAANEEAWLVRVLVNIRRDQWRKRRVRTQSAALVTAGAPTAVPSGESALIAKRTVWDALDALAPRRRAIVVMHELEGMTVQAVAQVVGVSAMTVRWHLSMARRDLRRLLAPYMGETQ
jgi:RNA polymerase sigma-70 factor, ECF subfamily